MQYIMLYALFCFQFLRSRGFIMYLDIIDDIISVAQENHVYGLLLCWTIILTLQTDCAVLLNLYNTLYACTDNMIMIICVW